MAEQATAERGGFTILSGTYSPPRSRDSCAAYLKVTPRGELTLDTGFATQRWQRSEVALSPRLSDGRRCLAFPDSGKFYPDDADKATAMFEWRRPGGMAAGMTRQKLLVGGILFLGALTWSVAFLVALPVISEPLSGLFPDDFAASLDRDGLDYFSGGFLQPSQIEKARQDRVRKLFAQTAAPWSDRFRFKLELRTGGMLGPNALALPAGTVVCTDELVDLAGDDAELVAVFAHEIGHVVRRHALRNLLQTKTLSLMLHALIGRAWKSDSVATAVPKLLVRTGYGRAFEMEADAFSRDYLTSRKMDRAAFGRILAKIAKRNPEAPIPSFLTTHPPLEERIEQSR